MDALCTTSAAAVGTCRAGPSAAGQATHRQGLGCCLWPLCLRMSTRVSQVVGECSGHPLSRAREVSAVSSGGESQPAAHTILSKFQLSMIRTTLFLGISHECPAGHDAVAQLPPYRSRVVTGCSAVIFRFLETHANRSCSAWTSLSSPRQVQRARPRTRSNAEL